MFLHVVHWSMYVSYMISSVMADQSSLENDSKKYLPGYSFNKDAPYSQTSCLKLDQCDAHSDSKKHLQTKPNTTAPTPNGCGPRSIDIPVPQFDFGACCNMHDYCYSKCDSHVTFELCNNAFASCMNDVCNGEKFLEKSLCNFVANVYSKSVTNDVGCAAYRNNAGAYCQCT